MQEPGSIVVGKIDLRILEGWNEPQPFHPLIPRNIARRVMNLARKGKPEAAKRLARKLAPAWLRDYNGVHELDYLIDCINCPPGVSV